MSLEVFQTKEAVVEAKFLDGYWEVYVEDAVLRLEDATFRFLFDAGEKKATVEQLNQITDEPPPMDPPQ